MPRGHRLRRPGGRIRERLRGCYSYNAAVRSSITLCLRIIIPVIRIDLVGFLAGTLAYVGANALLSLRGAQHRKRSGDQQPSEQEQDGSGTAIAIGALLDGVPESVVLGLSLLGGQGVGVAVLAAVFISNLPEGLSSSAGMKRSGRSATYVFGVWVAIAVASGLAGALGVLALDGAPESSIAAISALAAGAILAMVVDTMVPEAFQRTRMWTGLVAGLGFLVAFTLSRA